MLGLHVLALLRGKLQGQSPFPARPSGSIHHFGMMGLNASVPVSVPCLLAEGFRRSHSDNPGEACGSESVK